VQSLQVGASYAVPSDGDPANAASVNVAFDTLGDQTAFLAQATGFYKLANLYTFPLQDDAVTAVQWQIATGAGNTWTAATTGGKVATISGLAIGDLLELEFDAAWMFINSNSLTYGVSLATANYAPGATPPAPTRLAGSAQVANVIGTTTPLELPLRIGGTKRVTVAGSIDVWLMGLTGAASTVLVSKESFLTAKVWRATGMLQ
jgi:hypothetical protein